MNRKTTVNALEGKQDLLIIREFELPVESLFEAYVTPDIVEQWMGTKVLKLENRNHGSWEFETKDDQGNVVFSANGVIHQFVPNKTIVRTFEMTNAHFPVQLEFLDFKSVTETTSELRMQIVYKSIDDRDQMLKLPFSYGINMAHDRLQEVQEPKNPK